MTDPLGSDENVFQLEVKGIWWHAHIFVLICQIWGGETRYRAAENHRFGRRQKNQSLLFIEIKSQPLMKTTRLFLVTSFSGRLGSGLRVFVMISVFAS